MVAWRSARNATHAGRLYESRPLFTYSGSLERHKLNRAGESLTIGTMVRNHRSMKSRATGWSML